MTLGPDWRAILRYAWSVRLMILAAILSGLEVAIPLIGPYLPIPVGVFAGLSFLATGGAFIARICAQQNLKE